MPISVPFATLLRKGIIPGVGGHFFRLAGRINFFLALRPTPYKQTILIRPTPYKQTILDSYILLSRLAANYTKTTRRYG